MRIALDIMGGDHAPSKIVDGLLLFLKEDTNTELLLVGPTSVVREELKRVGISESDKRLEILEAPEVVTMEDSPRDSYRQKKNSSIKIAIQAVREGKADAFVTMGNTGASVFTAQLMLGVLPGVKRPGLAIPFPTFHERPVVMMDMGASVQPKAEHLLGYAIMASHYCRAIFGVSNPRIGLMNVGEESAKGNEVVKDAFQQISGSGLNFKGNAEGSDIFKGQFDVIVCDGFTGNVLLKACEELAKSILNILKEDIKSSLINQLATWVLSPIFKTMKKKTNPSEFGGALLLGVNGLVVIGHGKADGLAVFNALKVAKHAHEQKLNEMIVKEMSIVKEASPT